MAFFKNPFKKPAPKPTPKPNPSDIGGYIEVNPSTQVPTGREYTNEKGFYQSTDPEVVRRSSGGGGSSSSNNNQQAEANRIAEANRQAEIAKQQQAEQAKQQAIALANKQIEQERQRQILLQQQRVTAQNNNLNTDRKVQVNPYIEKRVVDYVKDSRGNLVPYTQTVYVDPTGMGEQKERVLTGKERQEGKFEVEGGEISFNAKGDVEVVSGKGKGLGRVESFISEKRTKELRGEVDLLSGPVAGVLASGVSSIRGVQQFTTAPIQTIKSIPAGLKLASNAVTSGELARIIKQEPGFALGYTGAEIGVGYATGYLGTKATKSIIPKVANLEIPLAKGTKTIKLFGYETKGGRALTLGYLKPDKKILKSKVGIGTPNIRKELNLLPDTTEIKIARALETKAIQKSLTSDIIGTTQRAQEFIPTAQTILRKTAKTKSKFIDTDNLFSATERLPKEGVQVFLDVSKEKGGILFGSKSRAAQLSPEFKIKGEKFKLDKVPRDVELRFDKLDDVGLKQVTDTSVARLKKLGTIEQKGVKFELGTAREISDTPFAIEAKVNGRFEKVAEFKGAGGLVEGEKVSEFVLGLKKTGKPVKIAGFEATPLREELRAVTQGVARVRKSKETGLLDIFPSPKREKDIASVSVSARTLEMSKVIPSFKLRRAIEKFESFYPEDLLRQQVKKINDVSTKPLIADFSGVGSPYKLSNTFNQKNAYGIGSTAIKTKESSPSNYQIDKVQTESYLKSISPSSTNLKISSPFVSPSPSPRRSPSPSYSPSPSPTLSPSPSPVLSPSPSPFVYPSPSPSPKPSPSPSPSRYPSPSPYKSPSPSPYLKIVKSPKKTNIVPPFKLPKGMGMQRPKGLFGVEVRRGGIFRNIGTGSLQKVQSLGQFKTGSTLGATYRIRRLMGGSAIDVPIPQGYYGKRTKGGLEIIEKRSRRLSAGTEKEEIQMFRNLKRKPKKRKKKLGLFDFI